MFGEKVDRGLAFTLGKVLPFVLTPGVISCFYCYTVLSIGPKDFKVDLMIKFESLLHICLNILELSIFVCGHVLCPKESFPPRVLSQDKCISLRYPCSVLRAY
jgi:hypothetical protein